MRLMTCRLQEGAVSYGEYCRPLGPGVVLDFDEVVGRNADGDVTLGHLLAGGDDRGFGAAFEPVEAPPAMGVFTIADDEPVFLHVDPTA
jgi:hypothetical protein